MSPSDPPSLSPPPVPPDAALIRKSPDARGSAVSPPRAEWEAACARFAWNDVRRQLGIEPGGPVNIGWLAVDRHLATPLRDKAALRFVGRDERIVEVSYAELARISNRFANVLAQLGVGRGERVFTLLGREPALFAAAIGTLKHGAVLAPLFAAFGPEPIRTRLSLGEGSVLVTSESLYRRRVTDIARELPSLRHVLLVGDDGEPTSAPGTLDLQTLLAQCSTCHTAAPTRGEDAALLHFTSGTTGQPKGALHVHDAVLVHYATGRSALDLHPEDTFWCTADPGWVTGTCYGIVAPLLHGATSIVDAGDFDPARWYRLLQDQRVSVWYTAPTAIRMLMRAGADLARVHRLDSLRFIASVGEPLNPQAVCWGREALGLPIHDNWWQTETGGIAIANTIGMDIKPGSMGRPLPGFDARIVRRRPDGSVEEIGEAGVDGELALRTGWPSMFRGYLDEPARYAKCFAGDLYLSGDIVRRDEDGYFWFVGRDDDVIKSAGHLIGPFEVESVLMEHAAVAEAGVIGKPDALSGESVKAFVSLKPGHEADDALRLALLAHARVRLGAAVAPKEIAFVATLPRTRSGKIMRRLLKARELGLPEGDLSSLENGAAP